MTKTTTVSKGEGDDLIQPTIPPQEPEIVIVDAEEVIVPEVTASSYQQQQQQHGTKKHNPSGGDIPPPGVAANDNYDEGRRCPCALDIQLCGDDRFGSRFGRQIRPGWNVGVRLCGNSYLTVPAHSPPGSHYKFVRVNLCGDTRVYCPRGTLVTLRRVSLCGNRRVDVDESDGYNNNNEATTSPGRDATSVTLTVVQLCGDIHVLNLDDATP